MALVEKNDCGVAMAKLGPEEKAMMGRELFAGAFDTYFCRSLGRRVSLDDIVALWDGFADDVSRGRVPGHAMFYAHTPYCFSRCSYCIYDSSVIGGKHELGSHLARMYVECKALSGVLSKFRFACMLIGGGTPGLHTDRNFEEMLRIVKESFGFRKGCIKSVEMTPVTTTESKCRIMKRYGINRVSLGVQSTTEAVLKLVNRDYQTMEHIDTAIDNIRKTGIGEVSSDLIAGLPGETRETFLASFDALARRQPDTIVLYDFVVPQNPSQPVAPSPLKAGYSWDEIVEMFFDRATAMGYDRFDRRYDFVAVYRSAAHSKWLEVNRLQSEIGSTLMGVGAQSFSNIFGRANYFNLGPADMTAYVAPEAYQCQESSIELEAGTCVRRFIEFGRALPCEEFGRFFGSQPQDYFSGEFAYLMANGLVEIADGAIHWRFDGKAAASEMSSLFFPDEYLAGFYNREKEMSGRDGGA